MFVNTCVFVCCLFECTDTVRVCVTKDSILYIIPVHVQYNINMCLCLYVSHGTVLYIYCD